MEHEDAVRTLAPERYLLGEMDEPERDAFEAHYFACAICAESVRTGTILADAAQSGHVSPGVTQLVPATARPAPRRSRAWMPLAAAAALALVTGYQTFVTIPGLRRALDAPQALAPIALAPASRGEGAVVTRDRTMGSIALALDINADAAASRLVYDLRTDDGGVVLSGQAPVPPQGTPLLLLIPGTSLTSGQYVIVVREADAPGREIGTYRFIVR